MKKHPLIPLLTLTLLLSLTAFGCGKDAAEPAPTPADQPPAQSQDQTPADDNQPAAENDQPPAADPTDTIVADGDLKPFSYEEIIDVFNFTEASLTDTYGQPQDIDENADELGIIEYDYGDMEFKLMAFEAGTDPSVFEAELDNDKFPAPRSIAIGDSLDSVIAKFPHTTDEIINEGDDTYHMLYGTFEYMGTFAYVNYDEDTPESILFAHDGVGMEIDLAHGKVSGYRYFMATN